MDVEYQWPGCKWRPLSPPYGRHGEYFDATTLNEVAWRFALFHARCNPCFEGECRFDLRAPGRAVQCYAFRLLPCGSRVTWLTKVNQTCRKTRKKSAH